MSGTNAPRWTVPDNFIREFHVSREARDTYQLTIRSSRCGTVVIPTSARGPSVRRPDERTAIWSAEQAVKAGCDQRDGADPRDPAPDDRDLSPADQSGVGATLEHLDETLLETTKPGTGYADRIRRRFPLPVYGQIGDIHTGSRPATRPATLTAGCTGRDAVKVVVQHESGLSSRTREPFDDALANTPPPRSR